MSPQYDFEVKFNNFKKEGCSRLVTFKTVSEESMSNFSNFKANLGRGIDEPFDILYEDEENDSVPIDTEDEYREFYKFAIRHLVKGNSVKLIMNASSLDEARQPQDKELYGESIKRKLGKKTMEHQANKTAMLNEIPLDFIEHEVRTKLRGVFNAFKEDLKKEIVAEIKKGSEDDTQMTQNMPSTSGNGTEVNTVQNEVASSNPHPESHNSPSGNFPKKLWIKDAVKLEKLELKRKKLLEKSMALKELMSRGSGAFVQDSTAVHQPYIMSGIAVCHKDNVKVTAGKICIHTWTITNDGTYPWSNVTLQHHWSTLGLEPLEHVIQCPNLHPGYSDTISVRFKAPKVPKQLQSYWFFHFQRHIHGPFEKFGHYVFFSGQSKLLKSGEGKNPDSNCKKLKLEKKLLKEAKLQKEKLDTTRNAFGGYVFCGDQEEQGFDLRVGNQPGISAETPNSAAESAETQTQSTDAALASTQIAAEMAREAAIAKFRRLMDQKRTDAPNKSDENKLNTLEETAMAALAKMELGERAQPPQPPSPSALNFVESGSDTDANNEESDPEFVMIYAPNNSFDKENQEAAASAAVVSSSTEKEMNTGQDVSKEEDVPLSENSDSVANAEPYPTLMFKGAAQQPGNVPVHFYPLIPSSVNADYQPQQYNTPQSTFQFSAPSAFFHAPIDPDSTPNAPSSGSDDVVDNYYFNRMQQSHAMYNKYKQAQHNSAATPYSYCKKSSGNNSPLTTIFNQPPSQASVNSSPIKRVEEAVMNLNVLPVQVAANLPAPTAPVSVSCFQTVTSSVLTSAISSTRITQEHTVPKTDATVPPVMEPSAPFSVNKQPPIEILPQALVDGAINVAASAYSTAWNALNNLRPKEATTERSTVEFDPVFENNMALLTEMGFRNVERNALLLKQYNNDLNQVIGIICATPPSDDFRGLNID